jgi:hypothetical protein
MLRGLYSWFAKECEGLEAVLSYGKLVLISRVA